MAFQTTQLIRMSRVLGLVLIAFMLVAGPIACKNAEEGIAEEGLAIKEGAIEFEGEVKVTEGQYVYIPTVRGFDLIVQGEHLSISTTTLYETLRKEVTEEYTSHDVPAKDRYIDFP